MPRHAAPAARRPARSRREAGAASAAARVAAVLPPAGGPPTGWVLPQDPQAQDPQAQDPQAQDPQAQDPQAQGARAVGPSGGTSAVPAPVVAGHPPAESGLLAALRAGRTDLTARGAAALGLVGLLAALLAGGVLLRGAPEEVAAPAVEEVVEAPAQAEATAAPFAAPSALVVAVAGQVQRPGVVTLPPGSRVADAVAAAGGLAPGAEPGLLNLARLLVDGEQVLVGPAPPGAAPDPADGGRQPGGTGAAPGPLDLNTASAAELDALPGLGPVLAERIVSWRERHGPFRSVEQLREVEGIGAAKHASLRDLVRV